MREGVWHRGEEAALAVYRGRGYDLLARNWRCALGELDLVLRRGDLVVVCEVKARSSERFGAPYEAVTPAKQRKLRILGEAFCASRGLRSSPVRFDVASVSLAPGGRTDVHVFEDAF